MCWESNHKIRMVWRPREEKRLKRKGVVNGPMALRGCVR